MSTTTVLVTAVLTLAGSGAVAALIQSLFSRRRIEAEAKKAHVDAASVLSDAALSLLEPLRTQIADLRAQLTEAHRYIGELETRLARYEH